MSRRVRGYWPKGSIQKLSGGLPAALDKDAIARFNEDSDGSVYFFWRVADGKTAHSTSSRHLH
jgi:hypothetical protein